MNDSRVNASSAPQHLIAAACDEDLDAHGDSFRGVGYTRSPAEAAERYALMLEVIRESDQPLTVLNLGCKLGHLGDVIESSPDLAHLRYTGLDISTKFLAAARARRPAREFIQMDILADAGQLPVYDYVILNGVFNYRGPIPFERMLQYWHDLVVAAYAHCRRGMAFNVMSTLVDWQRDDLFHLPLQTMTEFVWSRLSRHFVVRHDYRAYEYVTYVYRVPYESPR